MKILGPGGSLLTMNPAGLSMIGVKSFDDVKGKSVYSLVAPEHREAFKQFTEDVFRGKSGILEFEMTGLHGRRLWLETHAVPLRNKRNEIIALLAVTRDITERKRAQGEALKNTRLLQTFLQSIPDVIYFKDRDGRYQFVNRFYEELLHLRSDQILGKTLEDILPPGLVEKAAASDRVIQESGKTVREEQIFKSGGHTLFFDTIKTPLVDEQGNIIGLLGVSRDITDRKQMEDALRESEQRYHDLFENASDPIFILDAEQRYMDVNRKAVEVFGFSKEEFLQMKALDLVPPEQRERSCEAFKLLRDQGGYERFEGRVRTKDGRWLDVEVSSSAIVKDGKLVGSRDIVRDLTDRKRAEERLRESEKQLKTLINAIPDAVFFKDAAGRHIIANKANEELFGLSPEMMIGKTAEDLLPPEVAAACRRNDDEVLKIRKAVRSEEHSTDKNDNKQILDTIKVPLFDDNGVAMGLVVIARDVTERKRAEEALRESERFLQTIIETEPECVKTLAADGTLLTMNRSGLAMIQAGSLDQVKGQSVYPLVAPEHREAFKQLMDDVFRGKSGTLEFEMIGLQGRRLWLETHAVPLRNDQNEIIAHLGITRDITERKKAETFVKNILETVDEGFIVIDRDYTILSTNKAYSVQAGRPPEEIVGKKCYEISHGIFRPCYDLGEECAVRYTFETGKPHTVVHTHYDKKKNPIYVETKSFPMTDAAGNVTAAIEIVNNVTEKKKLEDQLRHAQKMEAVGLLAGGIAHDFNNILTAIIGYGNLLEMKLPPDNPVRPYVDQILASSARAANLTQSLLAFSRKQIINPRPVDVNEIIARVEKLLHRVIGEDVELQTALAPGSLIITADSSQIEQVLMNLSTNARDAMPEGGVLTIRTGTAVIDESFRKAHGFGKDGAYVSVAVKDTGAGMDEKTLERIFEPFFTTKEMGRGTGLGLAIVYGIMKQNNGYVTATSEPGKGSVFHLYFPLIEAKVEGELPARSIRSAVRGSGTILLAEDDPALRALIRTILHEFGYTVIEAVDGEDAVNKFREYQDRIQLLILDVVMPRKNGREAFTEMRKIRPGFKTLFISGYHDDIVNKKVLVDDGCHFIAKPVPPLDLLDMVQQILTPRDARKPF